MTQRPLDAIIISLAAVLAAHPLSVSAANLSAVTAIKAAPAGQSAALGWNALSGVGAPALAAPAVWQAGTSLSGYAAPSLQGAQSLEVPVMPGLSAVVPSVAPAINAAEPGTVEAPKTALSDVREAAQALADGKDAGQEASAPKVLDKVFDGANVQASGSGAAVEGGYSLSASESYLSKAPRSVLPSVEPQWKSASRSLARRLRYRAEQGEVKELGEEVKVETKREDLAVQAVSGVLAEAAAAAGLQDKVSVRSWTVPSAVKAVAAIRKSDKEALAWIDEQGVVRFHRFDEGKTYRAETEGKADLIAPSSDGESLYVMTGGLLQKWDLLSTDPSKETLVVGGVPFKVEAAVSMAAFSQKGEEGVKVVTKTGRVYATAKRVITMARKDAVVDLHGNLVDGVELAGNGLYLRRTAEGTMVYSASVDGEEALLEEVGTLPFAVKAVARGPVRDVYFAVSAEGLVEYEAAAGRYRVFKVPGLADAVAGSGAAGLDMRGTSVKIAAGNRVFEVEVADAREFLASRAAEMRLWSQANPMYVEGGKLHIGDFTFSIAAKIPAPQPMMKRAWNRVLQAVGRGVPD
ncbi:MAG: hypothetical protein HY924_00425, partial [Elusimicrobia bacterium]|nr:hypothetical protein [Elusimicrobiota bacterium]